MSDKVVSTQIEMEYSEWAALVAERDALALQLEAAQAALRDALASNTANAERVKVLEAENEQLSYDLAAAQWLRSEAGLPPEPTNE